ncbi:hypothetical protein M6D93_04140 [Jatrophihabitans telluris]|uniref:Uncharacterized protein n=1 Tax=Jatrophihabitans telluris TaxID=2038343 RepID=A0ABY4R2D4_9ACTN|nr:hypothetical protein [Jatrophihabitans telluris]UQX89199.1 hypothetical protein M6D93_04140 [Jatrophihabitans telluris]
MSTFLRSVPDDLNISPHAVATYLGASGWTLALEDGVSQYWQNPEIPSDRIRLPLETSFGDFARRFDEVLIYLSRLNDWDAEQLALQIVSVRSDILFLRADQTTLDGSIPIRQAERMLAGADALLLAAATSTLRPQSAHVGRRPDQARDFVENDVRMGHTQRGSFIITILARLGADEVVRLDEEDYLLEEVDDEASVSAASQQETVIPPFQRRAMATLASGVHAAREIAMASGSLTLDQAIHEGLSANMVDALQTMTADFEGLRALDMSFEWAKAEQTARPGVERVAIDRNVMPELRQLNERLRRKPPAPAEQTIYGQVTRLERGEDDAGGVVTVKGLVDTQSGRSAKVALAGAAYNRAIQAHRGRNPVTVTGTFTKRGNAYWIEGNVQLSFA